MITEQDLQAAIAECQGERHPTASTCIKLASYYVIQDRMFGSKNDGNKERVETYSFSGDPMPGNAVEKVRYSSDTEFSRAIADEDIDFVLKVMDELMSVLEATNPRLYNGVLRKLGA